METKIKNPHIFSTNNSNIQINVNGWKTLMDDSNYTFISYNVTVLNFTNSDTVFAVGDDGKFYIGSHTGSAVTGLPLYCHVFYKRR